MFNSKKHFNCIEKLIDQQGDILKIVEDQRKAIKDLQETVKRLNEQVNKEGA